jgi:hypothetical protein
MLNVRRAFSISPIVFLLVFLSFGQSTDPAKKGPPNKLADPTTAMPVLEVFHSTTAALEGLPNSRIDGSQEGAERRLLTPEEARKNRLLITKVAGKFYWASRENRGLEAQHSGASTYFYVPDSPGSYIKMTRVGNTIHYLEHVSVWLSTITYWGELQIISDR